MILFFKNPSSTIYAVQTGARFSKNDLDKLRWLFSNAEFIDKEIIEGAFIGPRKEMITPWSTNAVEITQNMGIKGIKRIEEFTNKDTIFSKDSIPDPLSTTHSALSTPFDPMVQAQYNNLTQDIFTLYKSADPLIFIEDIKTYNRQEGLALNDDEIEYLDSLSKRIGRHLTDCEVFGFSQVNSEHCRHKIFNGTFIIDGVEKPFSLFELIKKTSSVNKNLIISAYKDNCAFIQGPAIIQFAPENQYKPDYFILKDIESVLSLKAETHNFPTTVEPFNGAATGSGGEIRDRIAGGKGGIVLAGTAVYITSSPRLLPDRSWEQKTKARNWLYHSPEDILIKASNGASDFGNKFGQPLICGSLLTFEYFLKTKKYGYDKVIMLAGGIGYAKKEDSLKALPEKDENIIILGGDNYRIGMGGGAVSSVNTGEYNNAIELNAVQRSNPEMQKRVYNAIRALEEMNENPVVSIHDHGAGGHLNCLSELVESTGGRIDISELPIGDNTLSAKEIIGNESQERMGLIIKDDDTELLQKIAERERAPFYNIGTTSGDKQFTIEDTRSKTNIKRSTINDQLSTTNDQLSTIKPVDLKIEDMLGNPPKTIITDETVNERFEEPVYDISRIQEYIKDVLQIEAVACKDWLTNKVDRSVTGKVAGQQCTGEIQLPLNDVAVVALDYIGKSGMATSIGHAPVSGLIDPAAGSVLSVAEALTNIIWVPLKYGIKGISLSANWMWPSKNKGEDARLYKAVEAISEFTISLGLNIPTGKDSLSMTQKYPDGDVVYSPGTVIVSATAEVSDINKTVSPVIKDTIFSKDSIPTSSYIIYIDFSGDKFKLAGSSFAQVTGNLGAVPPTVKDADYFINCFNSVQDLILRGKVLAGHDISAGGMITALLEMNFANKNYGLAVDLSDIEENDIIKILFSENPGIIIQVSDKAYVETYLRMQQLNYYIIGNPVKERTLSIWKDNNIYKFDIDQLRDEWFRTSYLFDTKQCGEKLALDRYNNYKNQKLDFIFNKDFTGKANQYGISINRRSKTGIKAAIIREKGVNGDREMAYAMYLAGFEVKDVHMTDLISGRETLEDINFIVFVGGFSNSDVLGSSKGWAGAFLYNAKAKAALDNFYKRNDTLSLGVCNGCQLMVELGLLYQNPNPNPGLSPSPRLSPKVKMLHNKSGKFESAFLNVNISDNNSVMLKSLAGAKLGVWVAHGEGQFSLPNAESEYNLPMKYSFDEYPGNPNGSDYSAAALGSDDGRHLVMMPHLERAFLPWQWAYYPPARPSDEVSPWIEAFVNAREWIKKS